MLSVRFYLPAPSLSGAVSSYYVLRIDGDTPVSDALHPEWPNIRLLVTGTWSLTFADGRRIETAAPDATVSGSLSRSATAAGAGGWMVGVGLLPAGWARLTDRSASYATDTVVPLADLTGRDESALIARLRACADDDAIRATLDAWFADRLKPARTVDTLLLDAQAALLDPQVKSVADWAASIGRSPRQLERLALRYFGLPPKLLLRRQRFLRTFASIRAEPPGSWTRLIDEHYFDQPHFVRDCKHFMGVSPSRYFAQPSPFMVEAGNQRQALLGAPYQGLHQVDDAVEAEAR